MFDKSYYYYLIIFATIIFIFALIPIIFEIIQQKITSNIPYISLIMIIIGLLIFMFISISKGYYIHLFFYTIGFICISIILFFKKSFDKNNIIINKTVTQNYIYTIDEQEEQ